ncbi:MAG TPA: hypothetical protein VK601_28300 [Kofleriaceae bacterium]|nr:hypothetical protein [Kofleriaceae bacterium]
MTPELAKMVRRALTLNHSMDVSSQGMVERATHACEVLSGRLSGLVGEHGFCTLCKRCALRLPAWYTPWHASSNPWAGEPCDDAWLWLQAWLEHHDSTILMESFVLLLSEVLALLGKVVGEAVVQALVADAWPVAFPQISGASEQTR